MFNNLYTSSTDEKFQSFSAVVAYTTKTSFKDYFKRLQQRKPLWPSLCALTIQDFM